MKITFSSHRPRRGNSIDEPSQDAIENSFNLRQASLEDAARFGGSVTRSALDALELVGDREHIIVDTKVNFLLPGFSPAIPGWHTDGVPRGTSLNPAGAGTPNLQAQREGALTDPRYHLLVTGTISQTEFLDGPIALDIDVESGSDLYAQMTRQVDEAIELGLVSPEATPPNTMVQWGWWDIHRAVPATGRGWRYLIRVTETDHIAPRTDPSDFIRAQSQVYVPTVFGW